MLDTVCIHRRRDKNVGDFACTPGHYLDFGQTAFCDFAENAPASRLAILGGGQVFRDATEACIYTTSAAKKKVVWGVGISEKDRKSVEFDILQSQCALISSRNFGVPDCEYVPCASALSSQFDDLPSPDREVVLFLHARKSKDVQRVKGIPEMDNYTGDMASIIAHLARGETVVTNSYHGTYWAMCLGRKVLCLPFSHKFKHFKDNPVFGDPCAWKDDLARAERRPDTLEDARTRNLAFYDKVRNL